MSRGGVGCLVAYETCGADIRQRYVKSENSDLLYVVKPPDRNWKSLRSFFRAVFLPVGYPGSVSQDYLEYQIWDSIQAFASSITGTLATQSVLKGVGVGDESATILAATTTWLLKDGTGMIGRILFAWTQGSNLDYDCKRWRLFADVLNDAAIFLELISQHFRSYITLMLCISSVAKSVVGVAGGATRAALTQHQARRNNMADVSAKDGSQETLVNLAAFLFGLVLIQLVTDHHVIIHTIFVIFTCIHLYSNYRAVSCVVMETFNRSRFKILLANFLRSGGTVLSVPAVNRSESVWLNLQKEPVQIVLGASFNTVVQRFSEIRMLTEIGRKYSISNHGTKEIQYLMSIRKSSKKIYEINIVLHQNSKPVDHIQAMFQAVLLEMILTKDLKISQNHPWYQDFKNLESRISGVWCEQTHLYLLEFTLAIVEKHFPSFVQSLHQKGWRTDYVLFGSEEWRAVWEAKGTVVSDIDQDCNLLYGLEKVVI